MRFNSIQTAGVLVMKKNREVVASSDAGISTLCDYTKGSKKRFPRVFLINKPLNEDIYKSLIGMQGEEVNIESDRINGLFRVSTKDAGEGIFLYEILN